MFFARITDVAEGQGLAGGAIVLGYGLFFAFVALIIAFYVAYYKSHKIIILANQILFGLLVVFMAWFGYLLSAQ